MLFVIAMRVMLSYPSLTPTLVKLSKRKSWSPVRILDKTDIVEAWVNRSNRKTNVHIVEDKYVVTQGPLNRYSCTCTAYHYRRRCSHIDEVKNAQVSVQRS